MTGAGIPSPDSTGKPRALMTLADVAWPLDAGKRLRAASMVRGLAELYDLDVLVLFADADPDTDALPPDLVGEARLVPPRPRPTWRSAATALRRRVPWQTAAQDWADVRRTLRTSYADSYELVWFGALDHFECLAGVVQADRVVVDCDDVETVKLAGFVELSRAESLSPAERLQRSVEIPLWKRIQRNAALNADFVLVCSELDRDRLIADAALPPPAAARVVSVPNTYPEPAHRRGDDQLPEGPPRLVLIANYGTDQNLDAATWAATEVLPVLRQDFPDLRLRLVGRRVDRVEQLRGIDGLDVIGPVDSVWEELRLAHAVLVPIRFGGGTRLKIIEAFAYGAPVVTTRIGCEGIEADEECMLVADDPAAILDAVRRLLTEPDLARRLTRAGQRVYERSYSPAAARATIARMLGPGPEPHAGEHTG